MKKRILCFGDSNTYGHDPADGTRLPEDVRWTGVLQSLLGPEYTIIEEGLCGRSTLWDDPVEDHLSGLTYFQPCLDSASPVDLVIIMLGTNDTKNYFSGGARSSAMGVGRLAAIASRSTAGPGRKAPEVLVISPIRIYPQNAWPHIFDADAVQKSIEFPAAFRRVADEQGFRCMDAQAFAETSHVDGVHLDAENHRKLAEAICREIKAIIG